MSGVDLIHRERERQLMEEGWSPEHDDGHINAEMAEAARAYIWAALSEIKFGASWSEFNLVPNSWPQGWDHSWWKPSDDPIRNLVKAGALIAAEIDRLLRKES